MKKLALVLGSLLVVGSVASAKEVMPAPVAEPEVKIVEKPVEVIVYRDRVVEAPAKWRPNGYVSVMTKTVGEVESTGEKDTDRTWTGVDPKTRLEVKSGVALTENQNLEFRLRDWNGITHRNHGASPVDEYYLKHTYNFGKLGSSKVNAKLESRYKATGTKKEIRERLYFDFAEYLFSNDYVKTTAAEIAPVYSYTWNKSHDYTNEFAIYANYEADIIGGVHFQSEFGDSDDFFSYKKVNVKDGKDKTTKNGSVKFTLSRPTTLYNVGKHNVAFEPEISYETGWAWNKKSADDYGTKRTNGKQEKWGSYTASFEPKLAYTYQATEYIKLMANVGAEYTNRDRTDLKDNTRHNTNHWRWQPYAELGAKVNF